MTYSSALAQCLSYIQIDLMVRAFPKSYPKLFSKLKIQYDFSLLRDIFSYLLGK